MDTSTAIRTIIDIIRNGELSTRSREFILAVIDLARNLIVSFDNGPVPVGAAEDTELVTDEATAFQILEQELISSEFATEPTEAVRSGLKVILITKALKFLWEKYGNQLEIPEWVRQIIKEILKTI